MAEFHFLRPVLLWLLLLPIGAAFVWWQRGGLKNPWSAVCDEPLLKALQRPSISGSHWILFALLAVVWSGVMTTAAGPTWKRQPRPTFQMRTAGVVVVDMSENMLAADLKPDRLTRAKFKLRDLLNEMDEQAVGLIAFSKEPYVVSPVTSDAATIQALIPELSPRIMPVQGDNIGLALTKAQQLLEQSGNQRGFIILMTASPVQSSDLLAAKKLGKNGVSLVVLGLATELGAPVPGSSTMSRLDKKGLEELARLGRGRSVEFSGDNHDIQTIIAALPQQKTLQKTQQEASEWWDMGRYGLWLLLPFIALLFRRGWFEEIVS